MNSVMRFVLALTLIIGASEPECSEFDGSSHECEFGLVSLRDKLADNRIQVGHKQKVFHANLLKRYLTAEPESPEGTPKPADPTENESEAKEVQAVLWEKVENLKYQGTELETLNSLQKETVKDVKINPELSKEQQAEFRALLDQYTDIFTDVPSITNVSEHVI